MKKVVDAGSSGEFGWHACETALRCPRLYAYKFRDKKAVVPDGATASSTGTAEPSALDLPGLTMPAPSVGKVLFTVPENVKKIQPTTGVDENKAPLYRGSLIHAGLANYYRAMQAYQRGEDCEEWAEPEEAIDYLVEKEPQMAPWADEAKRIVKAYIGNWSLEEIEVLHVEEVFAAEIEGERYTQRLDLIVRERDGKVYAWDHKCQPASAVVDTVHGPRTIADLIAADTDWTCAAKTDSNAIVWADAKKPVPAGIQDVYSIRTKNGLSELFGYRHPIWTKRGWVEAKDIRAGDWVASAVNLPDRPEIPISDELLYIGGAWLADGTVTTATSYAKTSPAKINKMVQCLTTMGIIGDDFRMVYEDGRATQIVIKKSGKIHTQFESLGLSKVLAASKRVPKAMMGMSKRQTAMFLGAMWSGDGHVGIRKNGAARIVYCSRSKGLCEDVRDLLRNLGILSTVVELEVPYRGELRPYWNTTVVGTESKVKFLKLAKAGLLPLIDVDIDAALSAAEGARDKVAYRLDGDLAWDEVVSNVFVGKEPCYDIEVPAHHTFVSGGIVTHNTTGRIEKKTVTRYTLSGQFIGMRKLVQAVYGSEFGGVRINLLETGGQRFKFERPLADAAPSAVRTFPLTVLHARKIISTYDGQPVEGWPQALSEQTCISVYGVCEYFERCRFG